MKVRKLVEEPTYLHGYFALKAIAENEKRKAKTKERIQKIKKMFRIK